MVAANELRPSAELGREIEERSAVLGSRRHQLDALMRAAKNDKGEWMAAAGSQEQIQRLSGEIVGLTDQLNALKLDFLQAKNEEDLQREHSDPHPGAARIFRQTDGTATAEANGATKTVRLPDSIGEAFVESAAYKGWIHGGAAQARSHEIPTLNFRDYAMKEAIKATLTTATGPFTSIDKQPTVTMLGQQELTVADLFANAQTSNTLIRYIQEDTFTNAAAMTAEEGQKPEATWDLSEVDMPVRKIAVVTRTTTEIFEDYPAIRDYVNQRLPFMVRQREEFQLLSGDGTGQNLLGVINVPGVNTQAKGANTNIDTLYLGMTKVRTVGFFEPDAVVVHPNNWAAIRLLKTTIGDYVWGPPSVAGPETAWGKRVVITANCPANTAIVGAWRIGGTVWYRQGIRVEATNSDQNDFIYNRIALRAEQRECLTVWRPKAFCVCSGLDAPP